MESPSGRWVGECVLQQCEGLLAWDDATVDDVGDASSGSTGASGQFCWADSSQLFEDVGVEPRSFQDRHGLGEEVAVWGARTSARLVSSGFRPLARIR